MKLLTKTSLYYIVLSTLLFIAGGIVLFFILRAAIYNEVNERLYSRKENIEKQIHQEGRLPQASSDMEIQRIDSVAPTGTVLYDTILYDPYEGELEPFRVLAFTTQINGQIYQGILHHSLIESEELVEWILWSLSAFLLVLIIGLTTLNFWISKKVWAPFHENIKKIRQFGLIENPDLKLSSSDIKEFQWLEQAMDEMVNRIKQDYMKIKEFTENASHELQTPLAVIAAKIELLIQSETLKKEEMENIQAVYQAVKRLSGLNQALVLLTRIENREYRKTEQVDLAKLVEKNLNNLAELIALKHLLIKKELAESAVVQINPDLADIIISNLIGNAIKHNVENGKINIKLTSKMLSISNTGRPLPCPADLMFERFRKAEPSSHSFGLGLSIVKEIVDLCKFQIEYTFQDNLHIIRLNF
jgi:signal transduction histidine kinase